jgi:peptidyl-prolyl cis-trans isomerase SurA
MIPMRRPRLATTLLAAAGVLGPLAGDARAEELLVDGIAAQVGSRIVLVSDVQRTIASREAAMREMGAPESEIARLRADGLERMIESKLIAEVAERMEVTASDEEITATIESIARQNGLTAEQLYASVAYHGISDDDYREQIGSEIVQRNVVNGVLGRDVKIEEEELRALYEQLYGSQPQDGVAVHVRQLLVTHGGPNERTPGEACEIVDAAIARIQAGEDFGAVASEMSEVAPGQGGDIGWLPLAEVAPWMRRALDPLEPGQTSGRVEAPFGCNALQLVARRELEPVSFESVKNQLNQRLWEQKIEVAYREWIEKLREQTYIDRRGYFAGAARFGSP